MLEKLLICVLILGFPADGATRKKRPSLQEKVERIIAATPALARAHIGIRVTQLDGTVLLERNAKNWFVPASNTKLYSTALAMTRLGPDYRMTTRVTSEAVPGPDGTVEGDVRLVGGGDPSLSGRTYPYDKDKEWADEAPGIDQLADQIAARGVRRIHGAVIGDDTAFAWEPFPDGWGIDDPLYEYGAPVSALTLQDNAMRLEVRPGVAAGDPAEAWLSAEVGHFIVICTVTTVQAGEKGKIVVERPVNSNELRVRGTIVAGAKPYSTLIAVSDPALYAAQVLTAALERRGIVVRDPAGLRHRMGDADPGPDWPVTLATRLSPPLAELVRVTDKVSQNLHAELLLREVSRRDRLFGSSAAGLEELQAFLTAEVGLDKDDVHFEDGSGLSRLTLLTPEATTRLLVFMAKSPAREAFYAALPVGGEDGTLSKRFKGELERGRVHAKTGSLSHVSALGGYLEHPRKGRLAFTVLVNNYNTLAAEARRGIDKLVLTLLE